MPEFTPQNILVYSNGDTFGDALLKIPAIQALRATWPDSHISWLAGRGPTLYSSQFAYSIEPFLDEVIGDAHVGESWLELLRRPLAGKQFDLIIDTQQFIKTTLIIRRIPHQCLVSGTARFRFSDIKPENRQRPRGMLDRIMQLISLAAGKEIQPVLGIRIPEAYREEAARLLPDGARYIGFAPGAGQAWKCWPLQDFITVAQHAVSLGAIPVFFLGPQEQQWQQQIQRQLPTARFPELEPLQQLTPGPYLAMALGGRLAAAISNDSGTGHMLASANRPLITLYGRTDPAKFKPNTAHHTAIRAQDAGSDAMDAIPVDTVIQALDAALAEQQ